MLDLGSFPQNLAQKGAESSRSVAQDIGQVGDRSRGRELVSRRRARQLTEGLNCKGDGRSMGTIYNATYKVDLRAIRRRPVDHNGASSEFLDFGALAAKLGASEQWVRRNVRHTYTRDPIPHLRFGRAIRFIWDS